MQKMGEGGACTQEKQKEERRDAEIEGMEMARSAPAYSCAARFIAYPSRASIVFANRDASLARKSMGEPPI